MENKMTNGDTETQFDLALKRQSNYLKEKVRTSTGIQTAADSTTKSMLHDLVETVWVTAYQMKTQKHKDIKRESLIILNSYFTYLVGYRPGAVTRYMLAQSLIDGFDTSRGARDSVPLTRAGIDCLVCLQDEVFKTILLASNYNVDLIEERRMKPSPWRSLIGRISMLIGSFYGHVFSDLGALYEAHAYALNENINKNCDKK